MFEFDKTYKQLKLGFYKWSVEWPQQQVLPAPPVTAYEYIFVQPVYMYLHTHIYKTMCTDTF